MVKETELLTRKLRICENCIYILHDGVDHNVLPFCKKQKNHVGLFDNCESWSERCSNG